MAIRGPTGQRLPSRAAATKLSGLEKALLQSGLAKTPLEAKALAKNLLAKLGGGEGKGSLEQQLSGALKEFQQENGLSPSGKLDAATTQALIGAGLLGAKAQNPAPAGPAKPAPSGWASLRPQKGPKSSTPLPGISERGHVVEHRQAAERAAIAGPSEKNRDLSTLLESLSFLGFFGVGRGAEQVRSAVTAFQQANDLPQTGRIDSETEAAMQEQGVFDDFDDAAIKDAGGATAKAQAEGAASQGGQTRRAKQRAKDTFSAATAKGGEQDASERGVDQGDPQAKPGQQAQRDGAGLGGSGRDGLGVGHDDSGGADGAERPGDEDDDGANAPAGDENYADDERGHATEHGADEEAGYYEIAPLSEQIRDALDAIVRDDDGRGAVTYSWDVTFHKPGVYGAYQPAEPLWHVAVTQASAFDPVWTTACEALGTRLAKAEPDAPVLEQEAFILALRRARVRDASV